MTRRWVDLLLLCATGCATGADLEVRQELACRFAESEVTGCFLLHDVQEHRLHTSDPARIDRPTCPASTFKILNSLIALETGVIADENEIIRWDGVERGIAAWDKDHDLRSAIRASVVPVYQELARRIGKVRMNRWVERVGYGNADISGGVDRFWLDGGLRISARQQVEFLHRLYRGDLPFSQRNQDIVRDIMLLDQGAGWRLRGKTGWATAVEPQIGWFVGWVERGDRVWVFALALEIAEPEDLPKRQELTRRLLGDLGV